MYQQATAFGERIIVTQDLIVMMKLLQFTVTTIVNSHLALRG